MELKYRWTFFFAEGQVCSRDLTEFEKDCIEQDMAENFHQPIKVPAQGYTAYVNWKLVKCSIWQVLDETVPEEVASKNKEAE